MSGQMGVLDGQIYARRYKVLHIEKLVNDPDSMGCCLNGFVNNLVCGGIYILIVEREFSCEGAEDRWF